MDQLRNCFVTALALDPATDPEQMAYQKHPAWDSVGHMRLVAAIETAFSILFTTDQILDMSDFAKARQIVKSHGIEIES